MIEFKEGEAAHNLENHQKQIDAHGVEVGVSRQALDEVLTELKELRGRFHKSGFDFMREYIGIDFIKEMTSEEINDILQKNYEQIKELRESRNFHYRVAIKECSGEIEKLLAGVEFAHHRKAAVKALKKIFDKYN